MTADTPGFIHLRCHSAYSLLEGAIPVADLVARARAQEMPAVALTDSGNLFGALEFSEEAVGRGVQPLIGCQLWLARAEAEGPAAPGRAGGGATAPHMPDQIILLAQDETGYMNLMALVSRAYLDSDGTGPPTAGLADLARHGEGLICLSGGPGGPPARALAEGRKTAARAGLEALAGIFPGRLYVELQRHGQAGEARIEADLVALAYELDLPLVATNDVMFLDADMHEAHDALLCVAEGRYVNEADRRRVTPEHRFKSAAEMRALFADLPEAVDNSVTIARRCAWRAPLRAPILPRFAEGGPEAETQELRRQVRAGLEMRLARHVLSEEANEAAREEIARPYRERAAYELEIIESMGFVGYFLIVADFIQWAKARDIPVGPGRGSGAASVVAWALTITDLDPLRLGLVFERFLNPERISLPDFDIDFCKDRREEVIGYVRDTYGHDRVAHIITFGTLQSKAVLRDVGRVLEMPYGQVDRLSKLVPSKGAIPLSLEKAVAEEPAFQQMRREDETVARLLDIGLKLEGLYRNASTHAAGVVIGDRPLVELVPLFRDPRAGMPATQFNMTWVEKAGLVKFDFLGLKTLTVLQRAVEILRAEGTEIDLSTLPLEDEATFDMLTRGECTGVFQLESAGMRALVRQARPRALEDIIALISLYRPGPMENIPAYIAVREGRRAPDYPHPKLEPILAETAGIMIYQEQVLQAARVLAGYSLGAADLLRKAMGKKKAEVMDAERAKFVAGCKAHSDIEPGLANEIFDKIATFAGYGFNKAHAAAYALVSYQTAWMKAHYPVAFMAASMALDIENTDKLNVFKRELERQGIPLLPPDVNAAQASFAVETSAAGARAVRFALGAIKGVGSQAMESLVAERERGGPFRDLFDFAERLGPAVLNRKLMENLVKAGALDGLDPNRRRVFESIDTLIRYGQTVAEERDSSQESLFGGGAGAELPRPRLAESRDWPQLERLKREFEAYGFYMSAHPLDSYGGVLRRLKVTDAAELGVSVTGGDGEGPVRRMAGIVLERKEKRSARGNRYAFVQLSDATGTYETAVFSETLEASREALEPGMAVLITVSVERRDDEDLRLTLQAAESLEAAAARSAVGLVLELGHGEGAEEIRRVLDALPKGRSPVRAEMSLDGTRRVDVRLPGRYSISAEARSELQELPGVVGVRDE